MDEGFIFITAVFAFFGLFFVVALGLVITLFPEARKEFFRELFGKDGQ